MLLAVAFLTFLIGLLSLSPSDSEAQEKAIQTTLLVVHVGVVIVVALAIFYSGCHALRKIHSINTDGKAKPQKSMTEVVPIAAVPPLKKNLDKETKALVQARKKFGASSPQYREALRAYKLAQKNPKHGSVPKYKKTEAIVGSKRRTPTRRK